MGDIGAAVSEWHMQAKSNSQNWRGWMMLHRHLTSVASASRCFDVWPIGGYRRCSMYQCLIGRSLVCRSARLYVWAIATRPSICCSFRRESSATRPRHDDIYGHCKVNFAGVRNVEVRPAISTDPDPNPNPNRIPNRKLSQLEMAENNKTCSSATLPHFSPYFLLFFSVILFSLTIFVQHCHVVLS